MVNGFDPSEYVLRPPPAPSRARFYTEIATQNQNVLFPSLIEFHPRVRESLMSSCLYHYADPLPPLPPRPKNSDVAHKTSVRVVPADSLDCAEQLTVEGRQDVTILNMANAVIPGGAYLQGAGAQEEALCRRSTLYLTIGAHRNFHPIPDHGAIYSPNVLVVRKSDDEGCELLAIAERWWTSVISVAAIAKPRLISSGKDFARREDKEDTRERIRTVLRVAAHEGRKNLVLGALGCGAFKNPPRAVAILFRDVLKEREFAGRFDGIWFSIIERTGSDNFKVFEDILDGMEA